ncbi:hypothetical protein [Pseudomonas frederiksbergensis]|jgi:hypothetical protein|uniref:hypothetical protein n=1 Tax=Pseudomonas frederiksbergensis TaxID=104087 RepID=UPI003D23EF79
MPSDYSLPDVLEKLYENQQALEAAIMELTLLVEEQGAREVGGNVRGALWTMAPIDKDEKSQDQWAPGRDSR